MIHPSNHTLIHSSINQFIHSSNYPCPNSSIYTSIQSSIKSSINRVFHPSKHPSLDSSIHQFIHTSIHHPSSNPFIHPLINPFIYQSIILTFTHPSVNPSVHLFSCLHPLCWEQHYKLCVWFLRLLRQDCDHGGSCPPHESACTHTRTQTQSSIVRAGVWFNRLLVVLIAIAGHCRRRCRSIKPYSNGHNKAAGFLKSTSCGGRKWGRGRAAADLLLQWKAI